MKLLASAPNFKKRFSAPGIPLRTTRPGSIAVLSVVTLVCIITFVAFSLNISHLTNIKLDLQNRADAVVKAGTWTLAEEVCAGGNPGDARSLATKNSTALFESMATSDSDRAVFNTEQDIRFGSVNFNKTTSEWSFEFDKEPPNFVQVQLGHELNRANPVSVFLSSFLKKESMDASVGAVAAYFPATDFRLSPGSNGSAQTLPILPIAVDLDSWVAMENGGYPDDFAYSPDSDTVYKGSDGIPELKVFPVHDNPKITPGNRATMALGGGQNSTAKLQRQILYGLNEEDLEYHGGGFSVANGPLYLEGDPGISAAIEQSLQAIVGQKRLIPIFTEVNGNGATSVYTIVRFVGIRVLEADLRGSRTHKRVIVQPADMVIDDSTSNNKLPIGPIDLGTVFSPPTLTNIK
jgi:hypothetical protein